MHLPRPCGPISRRVAESLSQAPGWGLPVALSGAPVTTDRDAQLALWMLYELSYRGFDGVDPAREWDVGLIELRLLIEGRFESELRTHTRARLDATVGTLAKTQDVGDLLLAVVQDDDGPRLSSYLRRTASLEQMRDYLRERSPQQLKESDPQAFLVPRLEGAAKVALAELQYDEFGAGQPARLHQSMYARTLRESGLDPTYGAHVDQVSALSLASANLMSLFSMNRRLLAAGVGHFAAFEASSSVPSRRVAGGLRRLGLADAAAYFDEHVEADAVHEQIAARDVCGSLVHEHPDLLTEVVFGALAALHLDALSGTELLARWDAMAPADRPDLTAEVAS